MHHLKLILSLIILFSVSSCSLLNIAIESDVVPLPKRELNTRMAVRSFYHDFSGKVILAADSIYQVSEDVEIKGRALKWKMSATGAAASAAYQTVPQVSLVDTWLLCLQMEDYFNSSYGDTIFHTNTHLASEVSAELSKEISSVAKSLYGKEFKDLESFVNKYAKEHAVHEMFFPRENIMPSLAEYLEIPDTSYVETVGSAAEVMNDFTDRLSGYNTQIGNQLNWQKDLFTLKWENDSLSEKYLEKADSLSATINRLAIIAQESPEMLGIVAERMREELTPLIYQMNNGMETSIMQLSQERDSLQKFIHEQRAILVEDMNATGANLIKETTENVGKMIRSVSWVLIILVLVLAGVMFGIPFFAGYLLAKARFKKKE